ncbi:nodulation protein NopA [Bradyrhizobium sp. LHD-71]|uniref:nodulation protein NopA n=1 Tax=Bradyrhizobium sp. LHD-71 TaxID=3072141 RepID=UPI00280F9CE8|nr:nodulation protein NopA [Bradyrhizobium sp. LHD-71]MDQ8726890.1 nodulation protein NopA [Bradyrhizobium sp. LHD-71]
MNGIGAVGNAANAVAGGGGGAAGGDFQGMMDELKKTYQESMQKSMELRRVQVDQNTQKKVADERVQ